ncbi:MAG: hypothetical protein AAGI46_02585 [Planctomycetota bacterium]
MRWVVPQPGESADVAIAHLLEALSDAPHRVIGLGPKGPGPDGTWLLQASIVLPSRTTLVLAGACVVAAPDMRRPMLTNAVRHQLEGHDEQISVIGDGRSSFDGQADRPPRGSNGIHFCGVHGLSVSGIRIGRTSGWGLRIEDVTDVHVRDINFFQDGNHPWQDGVHINGPAERVAINGVTGVFGDDVIAVDSALCQNRTGGPIRGVAVSNVVAHNIHGAGIVRTIAAKDRPLESVHFSNLTLVNTPGKGSDAAIKLGWDGGKQIRDDWEWPTADEHKDIVIENVNVYGWGGPVICAYHPMRNVTIRNLTAEHTGPLFFNLEHEIKGLTLERVRSRLLAESQAQLNTGFLEKLVKGEVYTLGGEYTARFLESDLAAITFNHAKCHDIRLRDIALDCVGTGDGNASWATALAAICGATVSNLRTDDVRIRGYAHDWRVESDATVSSSDVSSDGWSPSSIPA